jgi:hypothetical protein
LPVLRAIVSWTDILEMRSLLTWTRMNLIMEGVRLGGRWENRRERGCRDVLGALHALQWIWTWLGASRCGDTAVDGGWLVIEDEGRMRMCPRCEL